MSIPQGAFFIVSQVTIVNGKKKGERGRKSFTFFCSSTDASWTSLVVPQKMLQRLLFGPRRTLTMTTSNVKHLPFFFH